MAWRFVPLPLGRDGDGADYRTTPRKSIVGQHLPTHGHLCSSRRSCALDVDLVPCQPSVMAAVLVVPLVPPLSKETTQVSDSCRAGFIITNQTPQVLLTPAPNVSAMGAAIFSDTPAQHLRLGVAWGSCGSLFLSPFPTHTREHMLDGQSVDHRHSMLYHMTHQRVRETRTRWWLVGSSPVVQRHQFDEHVVKALQARLGRIVDTIRRFHNTSDAFGNSFVSNPTSPLVQPASHFAHGPAVVLVKDETLDREGRARRTRHVTKVKRGLVRRLTCRRLPHCDQELVATKWYRPMTGETGGVVETGAQT